MTEWTDPMAANKWCFACSRMHVHDMPDVTYRCKDCGFGAWKLETAIQHRAKTGHDAYMVQHDFTGGWAA